MIPFSETGQFGTEVGFAIVEFLLEFVELLLEFLYGIALFLKQRLDAP